MRSNPQTSFMRKRTCSVELKEQSEVFFTPSANVSAVCVGQPSASPPFVLLLNRNEPSGEELARPGGKRSRYART